MPVWNGQAYVAEAIDSIVRQTYAHFELIVQDDHSTDDTPAVLAGCTDARLRVARNPRQLGQVGAANCAIARASGQYIRFFSHDDRMLPHDLETMVRCCEEHPQIGVCFSTAFRGIDHTGRSIGSRGPVPEQAGHAVVIASIEVVARLFYKYGCLLRSLSSLMVSRQALDTCGVFSPAVSTHVDWELCQRIGERYPIALLGQELCEIRTHAGQYSNRVDVPSGAREAYALLERLAQFLPPDYLAPRAAYRRRTHSLRYFRAAMRALATGNVRLGTRLLAEIAQHEHLALMVGTYVAYVARRVRRGARGGRSDQRFPYACEQP
jgi:glycosyltransferase involved in cell wall biosynthesis